MRIGASALCVSNVEKQPIVELIVSGFIVICGSYRSSADYR